MLSLNISTILLQMANFFILAFILYRFLFTPLKNVLKRRELETTRAMDEAQIAKQEAEDMRQQYIEKTDNIDAEIAARKNEARIVIERTRQQMLEEVQSRIERIEAQTTEKLAQLRAEAIQQHQKELGNLASNFARGILSDVMTPTLQDIYQEEFLKHLREIDLSSYVDTDMPGDVSFVRAIMANPTTPDYQTRLASILEEDLSQEVNLTYEIDPSLIAGGILRFEDELIDGSLQGQIDNLQKQYRELA